MLNFRRNGFIFVTKKEDWSTFTVPQNVSLDLQQINKNQNDQKLILVQKEKQAKVVVKPRAALTTISNEASTIPHLRTKWKVLVDNRDINILPIDVFLTRIAEMYQIKDVSLADSFQLLSLVTFCTIPGWVSFNDFVLLFTNFGEKNAILPKLISILNSNKNGGNWLRFEFEPNPKPEEKTCVYFNPGASYGFIAIFPDGRKTFIQNDFNTPFFSEFLVDEKGNRFHSWEQILA